MKAEERSSMIACVGFRRGAVGQKLKCKNTGRLARVSGELSSQVLNLCDECVARYRATGWSVNYVELKGGQYVPIQSAIA